MSNTWKYQKFNHQEKLIKLIEDLDISTSLAKLLIERGVTDFEQAKTFFRPELEGLHDPFLMKNMQAAVDRIQDAIANDEKILIYGDYDVDGTTSVALIYQYLKNFTQNLAYYIPDRYKEGYGVSDIGIDFAIDNDISLIIALDCGTKAVDKIQRAKDNGVDFIVCDHHTPGDKLPNAILLNPKQDGCNYPFKELCGCGVGFKVAHALNDTFALPFSEIEHLLDLVMVAIGADIVSVMDENRIMCHYGLKKLNEHPRIGFKELLKLAKKQGTLSVTDVVFTLAPRINAAGRIKTGNKAVQLLLTTTQEEAEKIGKEINEYNTERRALDKDMTQQALTQIKKDEWLLNAKSTVVFNKDWHKGVVGIVASRLIETYYRPTIVLTESNGHAVGSARSVKDFNVYNAIEQCSDLLTQFGGHFYAAGLTLPIENVPAFKMKFNEVVTDTITKEQLKAKIEITDTIEFRDIFEAERNTLPKFYRVLKQFAPFGPDNMHPIFVTKGVEIVGKARLLKEEHLKLTLKQDEYPDIQIDAIGFNMGHFYSQIIDKQFDIAYTIEENNWQGRISLQLMLKDIKFSNEY